MNASATLIRRSSAELLAGSVGDPGPGLRLAADVADGASLGDDRVGIGHRPGAAERVVEIGYEDLPFPHLRADLVEVTEQLGPDEVRSAAPGRIRLGLVVGPDDRAAAARTAIVDAHVDAVRRVAPHAVLGRG